MSATGVACSLLYWATVSAAGAPSGGIPRFTPVLVPTHIDPSYALMATANGQSLVAQRDPATATPAEAVAFDIPAQPLDQALEAYSAVMGQSVLYDSHLTEGRTSRAVQGRYTPLDALGAMLEGSGLRVRYTSAKALILVRAQTAASAEAGSDAQALQRYRGLLQAKVAAAFCADPRLAVGDRRLALRLWIGAGGSVEQAELLDSTGDRDFDAAVVDGLRGLSLDEAPPLGATQPFTMLILPRSSGQRWGCPEPDAGSRS